MAVLVVPTLCTCPLGAASSTALVVAWARCAATYKSDLGETLSEHIESLRDNYGSGWTHITPYPSRDVLHSSLPPLRLVTRLYGLQKPTP
jgi:hypothetical protein